MVWSFPLCPDDSVQNNGGVFTVDPTQLSWRNPTEYLVRDTYVEELRVDINPFIVGITVVCSELVAFQGSGRHNNSNDDDAWVNAQKAKMCYDFSST